MSTLRALCRLAADLDKCVARSPSVGFPMGRPTKLLASTRGGEAYSTRPVDTLRPLAQR
jgi:hypothetical protein